MLPDFSAIPNNSDHTSTQPGSLMKLCYYLMGNKTDVVHLHAVAGKDRYAPGEIPAGATE
jgi:hypothetical protein